VFRQLEQLLWEVGSFTPPVHVSAGHSQSVRTPATEDAKIVAVEQESSRSPHAVTVDKGLTHALVLNILHDDELHPYQYSHNHHLLCSMDAVL
jgi:hypothetical protein